MSLPSLSMLTKQGSLHLAAKKAIPLLHVLLTSLLRCEMAMGMEVGKLLASFQL